MNVRSNRLFILKINDNVFRRILLTARHFIGCECDFLNQKNKISIHTYLILVIKSTNTI